ncbi:hypothetical protein K9L67_03720 [Candidatus Woesearchaeota archaeon]|nr:hypothetical protein [Candidatus Woesearchaeota archaeon]MCF7901310.1 hypothetical protein [Candidatus Woesearchaeota archaeon]MCF8013784.1 hypothetical protein [Candidatus Woesearchaeota archaeon]
MINIPYEKLTEIIVEQSKLSKEEFDQKVKAKLDQLSGLISKEGAAHIIANELGINLLQTEGLIKMTDLLAGMKNIEVVGKLIRKYDIREFSSEKRSGKVGRFLMGDETGTTMIVLWNDKADLLKDLNENDIVKVKNVNVRENNGYTEVHMGESSDLEKNPEGVTIETKTNAGTTGSGSYPKATRKKISELKENDQNVEILATIVQVFDPKFFPTDSETGKRIPDDKVNEKTTYGAVLNLFADDGSDNIRVVLWKNQILNLLGKTEEQIMTYKDNPETFEEIKTDLLGVMAKLIGRVTKNEMFQRLEFIAQLVIKDPDPEEEIKKLEEQKPTLEKNTKNSESSEQKTESNEQTKKEDTKEPEKQKSEELDVEEELLDLDELEDL